jgi:hypothetical protein
MRLGGQAERGQASAGGLGTNGRPAAERLGNSHGLVTDAVVGPRCSASRAHRWLARGRGRRSGWGPGGSGPAQRGMSHTGWPTPRTTTADAGWADVAIPVGGRR